MAKRSITAQINKKREALIAAHQNVNRQNHPISTEQGNPGQDILLPSQSDSKSKQNDRPIGQQLTKCPLCSSVVRENRILTHLRRAHQITPPIPLDLLPPPSADSRPPLPQPPPRTQSEKGSLSAYVDTSTLVTDESGRVVSYRIPKPELPTAKKETKGAIVLKVCEICGVEFPARFIATHYRNIHILRRTSKPGTFKCILCEQVLPAEQVAEHRAHCNHTISL